MTLFFHLLQQLLPLYTLVGVGYLAARFLHVKKNDISRLLLYIFLPTVSCASILSVNLSLSLLLLPLLSFLLCTIMACIILFVGRLMWKDGTANMLSVGIANGNFGFLGLPLTATLLGQRFIALTALFSLGAAIFVATLGIYITARANFNARESIYKVLHMPVVYAFIAGVLLNFFHVSIDTSWSALFQNIIGAYSVLGLILMGVALHELGKVIIDMKLIVFTVLATYVLWPVVAVLFIELDGLVLHLYGPEISKVVLLMSIVPIGASIVALSTELKVEPQKAAFVVALTTAISLFYVPMFFAVFNTFFI